MIKCPICFHVNDESRVACENCGWKFKKPLLHGYRAATVVFILACIVGVAAWWVVTERVVEKQPQQKASVSLPKTDVRKPTSDKGQTHAVKIRRHAVRAKLSIKAALVYKFGGPQPIARTEFRLLNTSLVRILKEAGEDANVAEFAKWLLLNMILKEAGEDASYSEMALNRGYNPEALTLVIARIKKQTVGKMKTDFEGRGAFAGVKPGRYWVYAVAETRGSGLGIWNVPVRLRSGTKYIIIDQDNAELIF